MAGIPRAWVRPLQVPGRDYSSSEEMGFRRELEDYLLSVSAGIEQAKTRSDSISSEATKRSLLASLPTGQTEIGYEVSSYYSASKTLESGATTVDTNGVTWATKPTTWTANLSSLWAEDGTTGDIEYTGTGARKFYVSWGLTLDYYTSGSGYGQQTTITGKIEKTPDGGSPADVAGSIRESGGRLQYLTAFGAYFFLSNVSGSAIVSMAPDDKLSFRYGFANPYNVTTTFTATLVASTTSGGYAGTTKGATFNIIPAEFAE